MNIIKKKSLLAVLMMSVLSSQLFIQSAFAAEPSHHNDKNHTLSLSDNEKPGWGNGDKNHVHTGPPGGQSTRPGWGHGDDKHVHTGPPGRSVRAENHVNFASTVNIFAATGAKVMVTLINNITQAFHFGA